MMHAIPFAGIVLLAVANCALAAPPPALLLTTPSAEPVAEVASSTTVPPHLQQLCGLTSPPPVNTTLRDALGPVHYANISTGDLAYIRFGNASSSRPPLIYISGFGDTLQNLPLNIALDLSQDQEFIAFDNRGQGLSREFNTSERLFIEGMANDTVEFIQALNLTKSPTIMGHSMGGMIAAALVAEHGSQVGAVIVADGSAGGNTSTPPTEHAVVVLVSPNSTEADFLGLTYNLRDPHSTAAACNAYLDTFSSIPSPSNATTTHRQIGALVDWFILPGVSQLLPSVTNPVLLLAGIDDPTIPAANVRYMAQEIPKAWLSILPGRHAAFREWPDVVIQVFNAFTSVYPVN